MASSSWQGGIRGYVANVPRSAKFPGDFAANSLRRRDAHGALPGHKIRRAVLPAGGGGSHREYRHRRAIGYQCLVIVTVQTDIETVRQHQNGRAITRG